MSNGDETHDDDRDAKLPEELNTTLTGLADGMKTLGDAVGSMMQQIKTMNDRISEQKDAKSAPPKDEYTDLERLGRNEFMNVILDKVGALFDSKLEPLSEQVGTIKKTQSTMTVDQQIKEMVEKHDDFWDWKQEIGAKVKANPYLTAEEAYNLVRIENPKKAKELDEKYKPEEEPEEDPTPEGKPRFGGLTPTSGAKTEGTEDMDADDAADAAWDKVFGGANDIHV